MKKPKRKVILLDEWLAYVETDKELELTNGYEMDIPGIGKIWHDAPGYCKWIGHPAITK